MLSSRKYDFIFLGAGCASLSLLMRMIKSGKFSNKQFLLIDKETKTKNDRTWCFWEKQPGFFEDIVYKKWSKLSLLSDEYSDTMDISPYEYKMIRGIDFYNYCFDKIKQQNNIEIVYGDIQDGISHREGTIITIDQKRYDLDEGIVFNSIPAFSNIDSEEKKLLQHFKGWIIESGETAFDPSIATIMDFRVAQRYGTTFAYVLPFSQTKALIEYTLFGKKVLDQSQYDNELEKYLEKFYNLTKYAITETEFGIIPMTDAKYKFQGGFSKFNIGAAGGQTKASSGYTYQFIQKQSQQITDCLINDDSLFTILPSPKRFRFYDNTLLHILYHNKLSGKKIFTRLFQKNKPQSVLKFLDNETTLSEELKIISTLPTFPFLKAAIHQL